MGVDWGGIAQGLVDSSPGGEAAGWAAERLGNEGFAYAARNPSQAFSPSNFRDTFGSQGQGNGQTDLAGQLAQQAAQQAQAQAQQAAQYRSALPTALSYAQGQFGPDQQALGFDRDSTEQRIGMALANQEAQTGFLTKDHQLALQMLGLDRQGITTEQQYIDTMQRLAEEQFGLNKKQAGRDFKENYTDLRSEATARGAYTSALHQDDLRNNYGDLLMNVANLEVGYEKEKAGFQKAEQGLAQESQRLGISEKQLKNQLDQGLHQLGLDTWLDVNSLFGALYSNDAQQAALARQIIDYASGLAATGGVPGSGIGLSARDRASVANRRGN